MALKEENHKTRKLKEVLEDLEKEVNDIRFKTPPIKGKKNKQASLHGVTHR